MREQSNTTISDATLGPGLGEAMLFKGLVEGDFAHAVVAGELLVADEELHSLGEEFGSLLAAGPKPLGERVDSGPKCLGRFEHVVRRGESVLAIELIASNHPSRDAGQL